MSQLLTFPKQANRITEVSGSKRPSFSPHPPWIVHLINETDPYQQRIFNCPLVKETSKGTLSLEQMRGWLMQLYPFIRNLSSMDCLEYCESPGGHCPRDSHRQRSGGKMACEAVDGHDRRLWYHS